MLKRQDTIIAWLPLVRAIAARQFRRLGVLSRLLVVDLDDVFHIGVIGLMRAVDKLDPASAEPAAYFAMRIRGAILDFLRSFPYFKDGEPVERVEISELDERQLAHSNLTQKAEAEAEVSLLLRRLPCRQQVVWRETLRGASPKAIARALGVKQSRVSQIKKEGLERLRAIAGQTDTSMRDGASQDL
jgi:RNA polymerase sigma factor (sigma-70 family)